MVKRALVLLMIATFLVAGCGGLPSLTALVGSGNPVTQTFDFNNFDSLEISNAFQAEVVASDSYSLEVTVDDNLVDRLQVEQRGSTVVVGLDPNTGVTSANLHARITMPGLVSLNASGATRVDFTGFQSGEKMRIKVSGASTARGNMETGDVNLDVSGASKLVLSGRGASLQAIASGASTADLSGFTVTDVNAEASGASLITVNASGRLDARASGASSVRYTGNPTLGNIDESGASTVAPQ